MRLEYFQLIDQIVEVSLADRTIRVAARVPDESTIFEGHFPGYPLMPGVLLIEAMAQSSGWIIIAATNFTRMPFLAAVKEAKLRQFVRPGTDLTLTATLIHEGSGYAVTKVKATTEGKPVCDAELTFRVMEFPTPAFRETMQSWAARLQFPMGVLVDG